MRGSLARLGQWDCKSPACWREFKEFGGLGGGGREVRAGETRRQGEGEEERGHEGGSGKAPEV